MKRNTTKLKYMSLLSGLYFYIPIFALYFTDNGVTVSTLVFSQIFYSIFSFFGEIPTGIVADRYGQKNTILLGYTLEIIGIFLFLMFPTYIGLYIGYAIRGFAGSCLSGSEEALGYESCKNEQIHYKQFSSIYNTLHLIGFTVSSFFTGIVLQFYGTQSYIRLLWFTIFSLCITLFVSLSLKPLRGLSERVLSPKEIFKNTLSVVKSNNIIRTLAYISLLTLNGQYFLQAVYAMKFQIVVLQPYRIGLALGIGGVINVLISRYIYKLESYISYEKILLLVHLIMGIAYIFVGGNNCMLVLIGFIVCRSLFNSHNSVTSDYVNQEIPSDLRSTTLSSLSFIKTGGQIITRFILGFLVTGFGVSIALYIQGIYILVGITIGYWLLIKCGCIHKIAIHSKA